MSNKTIGYEEIRAVMAEHPQVTKAKNLKNLVIEKYNLAYTNQERIALGKVCWDLLNRRGKLPAAKAEVVSLESDTKPFILSAWSKEGHMMDFDEYCEFYKLDRSNMKSYKLVSHTGTPYYNIQSKDVTLLEEDIDFEAILSKYVGEKPAGVPKPGIKNVFFFDRLVFTDTHIGMDPNKAGTSMFPSKWGAKELCEARDAMLSYLKVNKTADTLIIDDLGDLLDGFDGYTTRGGHKLPQSMTNEEVFDLAVQFKVDLLRSASTLYKWIQVNNICNDNHSGAFGYFVNSAVKRLIDCDQSLAIRVSNYQSFINHYSVGEITFVITHGKDNKDLKFGLKPKLDSKGVEMLDKYCKYHKLYDGSRIIICKGDSHQALFDMSTSQDFDYFNYPALAPSSQWVQTNFGVGRQGFVFETYKGKESTISLQAI